jgi:high-affinity iron transporter
MNRWTSRWICGVLAAWLALTMLTPVRAAGEAGWQTADAIQKALQQAQLTLSNGDTGAATQLVGQAERAATRDLLPLLSSDDATATQALAAALARAAAAATSNDMTAFAAASAGARTALFGIGALETQAALRAGNPAAARGWLLVREFRRVSRFQRLNTDATSAVLQAIAGKLPAATALATVQTDLLDTYQARLTEALHDLSQTDTRGLAAARAQNAALAAGYFAILAPTYGQQRGDTALASATHAFAKLSASASAGQAVANQLPTIDQLLHGFRAAPLSAAEQTRRAGQMLRFLSLAPVEYARGVTGEQVTVDLEIQEATIFRDGAAAAFADLRSILDARDPVTSQQIADDFDALEQQLADAKSHTRVAAADTIQTKVDQIASRIKQIMPTEWQQHDNAADFDVIAAALDQMQAAVAAGQYELAESARLEAYAILESGPEAKLIVFAPQHKAPLEDLFWYGQGQPKGLAYLIGQSAPVAEIMASRKALDAELAAAQAALAGSNAPVAVASNAAIIVFREGLEAVLILASLMGSLKLGAQRRYRRPLWWGAVGALLASALTWLLARGLLSALARYGERLEAIVSLIAIGVLLLITNWFFHKVYWNGWIANFHTKKRKLIGGSVGQWLGLALLGFTSIYREGFETVLFLQALVLEAGAGVVLSGVALGLGGTLLVGFIVFSLQAKLPYKKMLIVTGVMIGAVLLQMVGNTIHVMQVVGWMPIHPIRWLELPYWAGMWFGLYGTWEGIGLQIGAAVFVIGSYLLAERMQHRQAKQPQASVAPHLTAPQRPLALREKESNTL